MTGANGLAGRAVVRDLLEHGYDVTATDIVAKFGEDDVLRADLTDNGQAVEATFGTLLAIDRARQVLGFELRAMAGAGPARWSRTILAG